MTRNASSLAALAAIMSAGLALPALAATTMNNAEWTAPAYVAKVDPSVHFPDKSYSWLRQGRFVSPHNIRMIAPGMLKPQIYPLLGEPMFNEAGPFVRTWNYIFDFNTPSGVLQCQFQIKFEGEFKPAVTGAYWKDAACAKLVEDAPPPPPPPPPPTHEEHVVAAPPKPEVERFTVYFPFDKSDLTPAAVGVIARAAKEAPIKAEEIIVGYTDASGTVEYNLALSARRAKSVAEALVSHGIDPASLDVSWKGKADLAVPTPEGVKEPLNRRATITIEPK